MSKRSSRIKRRKKTKKKLKTMTGLTLAQEGKEAFDAGKYQQAIRSWTLARAKSDAPASLPVAIAEAYFRRAMTEASGAIDNLKQAEALAPTDPLYRYHLALAHHKSGDLEIAEPIYRALLQLSSPFVRAAEPLAQLLIAQKRAILTDHVWQYLTKEQQAFMTAADAISKKKATSTIKRLLDEPLLPHVWRGMVNLSVKQPETAWQYFEQAVADATLSPVARGLAHYNLGMLLADKDREAAYKHLQIAKNNGLSNSTLNNTLSELAYAQAVTFYRRGDFIQADNLLQTIPEQGNYAEFIQHVSLQVAFEAARQKNWEEAYARWEKARKSGNSSRRLVFNLALACQNTERYFEAAEYWRTVLSRRPRKADHPDALTNQQVARIWQAAAENYAHAGDYHESIQTYKNAVKWAPDNIDLRLQLVEAYQFEGRWQAAENEINRVLKIKPDHIPALLLLAECYSDDYLSFGGRDILMKVLKLDPTNPVARQQLAYTYEEQAQNMSMWLGIDRVIDTLKEGLQYLPNNQRLLTLLGDAYAETEEIEQARQCLRQAYEANPRDLKTLHNIYAIWLYNDSPSDLAQTFAWIEAIPTAIPGHFFIDLMRLCHRNKKINEMEAMIAYILDRYATDDEVLIDIAEFYVGQEQDKEATPILRRILQRNPHHIDANVLLGNVYFYADQVRLAKRHWDMAETQAKRVNDQMMLYRIRRNRDELLHGKSSPANMMQMINDLPPELKSEMLKGAPPEILNMLNLMNLDDLGDLFEDDDEY